MNDPVETQLSQQASEFAYPPTPDVAGAVNARLKRRAAMPPSMSMSARVRLALWLLVGVLALGSVAAVAWRVLRIGAVRIDVPVQTAVPTSLSGAAVIGPSVTPSSTATHITTPITTVRRLLNLEGETTLAVARASVTFTVPLPSYPADIGMPTLVYHQRLNDGSDMVVLVWAGELHSRAVRMSLHILTDGVLAHKMQPKVVRETTVNGVRAAWVEGEHFFVLRGGNYAIRRLVDGNTLIWARNGITYRLESDLSLEEAVKVAESVGTTSANQQ